MLLTAPGLVAIEGYIYLLAVMAAANLMPPLPAEATIPFAAALFDQHALRVPLAIAAAAAGLVLGTLPLYFFGRVVGEARLKRFLVGRGRWLLIKPADIDRSGGLFRRYGDAMIVVGRLIPGMRSMISVPAGLHRMPFGRFLVSTAVGSTLWASVLIGVGHGLSHALHGVTSLRVGLVLLGAMIVLYLIRLRALLKADRRQN